MPTNIQSSQPLADNYSLPIADVRKRLENTNVGNAVKPADTFTATEKGGGIATDTISFNDEEKTALIEVFDIIDGEVDSNSTYTYAGGVEKQGSTNAIINLQGVDKLIEELNKSSTESANVFGQNVPKARYLESAKVLKNLFAAIALADPETSTAVDGTQLPYDQLSQISRSGLETFLAEPQQYFDQAKEAYKQSTEPSTPPKEATPVKPPSTPEEAPLTRPPVYNHPIQAEYGYLVPEIYAYAARFDPSITQAGLTRKALTAIIQTFPTIEQPSNSSLLDSVLMRGLIGSGEVVGSNPVNGSHTHTEDSFSANHTKAPHRQEIFAIVANYLLTNFELFSSPDNPERLSMQEAQDAITNNPAFQEQKPSQ